MWDDEDQSIARKLFHHSAEQNVEVVARKVSTKVSPSSNISGGKDARRNEGLCSQTDVKTSIYGRIYGLPAGEYVLSGARGRVFQVPHAESCEDSDSEEDIYLIGSKRPSRSIYEEKLLARVAHESDSALASHFQAMSQLDQKLFQLEEELRERLKIVDEHAASKQAHWETRDQESQKTHSAEREDALRKLQREQRLVEEEQQKHVERARERDRKAREEAARKEAERLALEKKRQEELEAEHKRTEEEARKRKEKEEQEARRKKEKEELERKKKEEAAAKAIKQTTGKHGHTAVIMEGGKAVYSSPSALEEVKRLGSRLVEAEQKVAPLVNDPAMKSRRREVEKNITKYVSQISATKEQIRNKTSDLQKVLRSCTDEVALTYACLVLTQKLVSQCEAQVVKLHSFAFALAVVTVRVGAQFPLFMELMIARLYKVCPLCIPQYQGYLANAGVAKEEVMKDIGYKEVEDIKTGAMRLESTEEYLFRIQGYLLFYGAITQVDEMNNPYPLRHAWVFLSRLLNHLPANKSTSTALVAFIRVTGFQLYRTYRSQFMKILQYIYDNFLPELKSTEDPETRAVYTRLITYLESRQFEKVPEGRDMPENDDSQFIRS